MTPGRPFALGEKTLGLLGAGNMAEAIVRGLLRRHTVPPQRMLLRDVRAEAVDKLTVELGVRAAGNMTDLMAQSDVLVLAIKPQNLKDLLPELRAHSVARHLVVTMLAGTRAETLEEGLRRDPENPAPRVVRVMPNTPALLGAGATALSAGANATGEDMDVAAAIFEAVGVTVAVEPHLMDAVTGLSGSGPAYVFRMIEALTAAGIAQGLAPEAAEKLVKQTVYGAAMMALQSDVEVAELRRRVTSPKGTTERGLTILEEQGFMQTIEAVVDAATKRSVELGRG